MTFDETHNCLAHVVGIKNKRVWFEGGRRKFDRFLYRCGLTHTTNMANASVCLFFARSRGNVLPFHFAKKEKDGSWSHKPGKYPLERGISFDMLRFAYGSKYRLYKTYV